MVKTPPKETIIAYLSGAVFAAAWFLWIDAVLYSHGSPTVAPDAQPPLGTHWLPGIGSTIALILTNIVSWKKMENASVWGDEVPRGVSCWILLCFFLSLGSLTAAIWCAVAYWWTNPALKGVDFSSYSPIALIAQNVMIFGSSLLYMYKSASSGKDSDF